MPGRDDQRVLVHLPKFTLFEKYASVIEIARNHVIKRRAKIVEWSEPEEPPQRFCSQCGEASSTRSTTTGAVVLSSSGYQDGLTLNGSPAIGYRRCYRLRGGSVSPA
jgi:hypothetical protein